MNRKLLIVAVPGRAVDDPDTGKRVGDEPVSVDNTAFWRRRLKDNDVALASSTPIAIESEPQSSKTKGK